MKHWRWRCALGLLLMAASLMAVGQLGGRGGQDNGPVPAQRPDDVHLPNGKSQRDEILKAEHEQNVKDAAQLSELAQQLQQDLEKDDRFVLSMSTLKKAEDIEKLAHKIRTRLRHN
jgi:hypothetical protein